MADTVIYGTTGDDVISSTATGTSTGSLVLTLAGTIAQGEWPLFDVLVNGSVVRANVRVMANDFDGATQQVYVSVPGSGINSISIDYKNDPQTNYDTQDRNLVIKSVMLNGTNLPVTSATYTRDGFVGDDYEIEGQEYMLWGGEMTWTGSAVQNATAGPGGSVLIDGDTGIDTVTFANARSAYNVSSNSTGFSVTPTAGGTSTFFGSVERLQFGDGTKLAIDVHGNGGTAAKMIATLLGSSYLANESIAGDVIEYLDNGTSALEIMTVAVSLPQFHAIAGGSSDTAFVNHVFNNLAGYMPSQSELDSILGLLNSGAYTKGSLALAASELEIAEIRAMGVLTTGFEYA